MKRGLLFSVSCTSVWINAAQCLHRESPCNFWKIVLQYRISIGKVGVQAYSHEHTASKRGIALRHHPLVADLPGLDGASMRMCGPWCPCQASRHWVSSKLKAAFVKHRVSYSPRFPHLERVVSPYTCWLISWIPFCKSGADKNGQWDSYCIAFCFGVHTLKIAFSQVSTNPCNITWRK